MASKKAYFVLAALVGLLLLAAIGLAVVNSYIPLPLISRVLSRPATDLSERDYAVYSGFVDGFFFSQTSPNGAFRNNPRGPDNTVLVADQTLQVMDGSHDYLPLYVAALGPPEMGYDFFRQNTRAWHVQPLFQQNSRIALVSSDQHDALWGPCTPVLRVSRIGFNFRRTLALLYFSYTSGPLCCQSGYVSLRKDGRRWVIDRFGLGAIY